MSKTRINRPIPADSKDSQSLPHHKEYHPDSPLINHALDWEDITSNMSTCSSTTALFFFFLLFSSGYRKTKNTRTVFDGKRAGNQFVVVREDEASNLRNEENFVDN